MRFTNYRGYEKTDRVIKWFWTCLRSWPAWRHGYLARARRHLQGSRGQRLHAPLYDREECGPERPPTQLRVLQSSRPAVVRGLREPGAQTLLRNRVHFLLNFSLGSCLLTEVCLFV